MDETKAGQEAGTPRTPILEALQPLCSSDPHRTRLASPFAVNWGLRKWAAATDGHFLVMLPFDGDLRTDGPDAIAVIPAEIPPPTLVDASRLLAFAGVEERRECGNCSGSGKCDFCGCCTTHACGDCDGKGTKRRIRYGLLLDGGLDLDFLRTVVLSAPPGTTRIGVAHGGGEEPFVFTAPDWMSLLMPIRPGTSDLKDAPRFDAEAPARPAPSSPLSTPRSDT